MSAKKAKKQDISHILNTTINSPDSSKLRQQLSLKEPIPLSPDEALAFIIENSFSKQQYINIRLKSIEKNCNIYTSYEKVREAKEKCRPIDINVSDTVAEVPMQNLLNHTASRIILYQKPVFQQFLDINKVKLICSKLWF